MKVTLRDYDVIVVNTSSGKDSQTLLDLVCTKASQEGVLDRVMCAHADLGRIEWPGATELAEQQAGLYGVPFWKMARPNGDMIQYAVARGKWPSPKQRWCTSDFKRDQINKLHTKLSKDMGSQDLRILNCMGMRAEESPARAKLTVFRQNKRASTKTAKRRVDDWIAIKDWKLDDVWANIKASGIPHHKAYDMGMPRLSCCFCIFAPKSALLLAGQHNPELLDAYVRAEKEMGHTFKADLSLAEIQDELKSMTKTTVTVPDWRM